MVPVCQRIRIVFFGTALGGMVGLVCAQQNLPTVDELKDKLAPRSFTEATATSHGGQPAGGRSRGLVIQAQEPDSAAQAVTLARPTQTDTPSVNAYSESRITFEFNSDKLTPFARKVLDVFAAAIQTPDLRNVQFIIEGHTDGSGSDQYNLELSRKRADAVIKYLVDNSRLDPSRFAARGKGRRELLNPDDPSSRENRRVVWISQR